MKENLILLPSTELSIKKFEAEEMLKKLDKDNLEFKLTIELIQKTSNNIYLTGKAGSGKTTFLKYLKLVVEKNMVVLAPTGVAAMNAGGVTIHSFFQIPFGLFTPDDPRLQTKPLNESSKDTIFNFLDYKEEKIEIIRSLDLLVIDEVSMVRCDMLDVIDKVLRAYREEHNKAFGGVQVILIGDLFQLPPIVSDEDLEMLKKYYKNQYFFSSHVLKDTDLKYVELKKIYRQSDSGFINLLNKIRVGEVRKRDLEQINSRYKPDFDGIGENYITIATHNKKVDEINRYNLEKLSGDSFSYEAIIWGKFPEKMHPTIKVLELKKGAQVMFIKNDSGYNRQYYNGKIGTIVDLGENYIEVEFKDETTIIIEIEKWENIKYVYNKSTRRIEEEVLGSFEQYPIKLAWAVTVHKSQGLTFEKVIADLSQAFEYGQVYVALSRCKSFDGLVLKSQLCNRIIKTDPKVLELAANKISNHVIAGLIDKAKYNEL